MRKTFEMKREDIQQIERITRSLKPGQEPTAEMTDRLNKAWANIGNAYGFDWNTVEAVDGKPYTTFSAEEITRPDGQAPNGDPETIVPAPGPLKKRPEIAEAEPAPPAAGPEIIPFSGAAEAEPQAPDQPEAEAETKGPEDETIQPEGEKNQPQDETTDPAYTPENETEKAEAEPGEQKPLFGPEDNVRNVLRHELSDLVTELENLDKRIEKAEAEKENVETKIQEVQIAIRAFEKIAAGNRKGKEEKPEKK